MANLFISYRREDSAPYAGRLSDRLGALFGPESVFLDVQDIHPGQDFEDAIARTIAQCHVLLVVIGPAWLSVLQQRAGQAGVSDYVQTEITEALARKLPVIPVLVGGAQMPASAQMPEALRSLSRYQAVEIRSNNFEEDFQHLASALRTTPGFGMKTPARRSRILLWTGGAAVLAALAVFLVLTLRGPSIDGVWLAEMHKKGQPAYHVRFRFVTSGRLLTGTVEYPTGQGVIQNGSIAGQRFTFETVHTPQFDSTPALSQFTGQVVRNRTLRLTSVDNAGVATGTANRAPASRAR